MNKVILVGRLTRDPDIRYTQGDNAMCIARYTLAVDRRTRRTGNPEQQTADFIPCVAFGKTGEFVEKYLVKGTKVGVEGSIQTGSYTNRDGIKVYTTEVRVDSHEFMEGKKAAEGQNQNQSQSQNQNRNGSRKNQGQNQGGNRQTNRQQSAQEPEDGFMNLPDGIDEELPFD